MLLSSLSLNLFCRFLTCFSHPPLPPSIPHPLGISNTRARLHARAQMHNTHTQVHAQRGATRDTHARLQTLQVGRLISAVVTSEGCYSTARHLDTHGILHYSVSKLVCVLVCVSVVRVHASCPLRCVWGWVGEGCHRRLHVLRVSHQLFLDGPQRFRRSWRCWMSLLTYMMHSTCTVNATHLYVHV